MTNRRLGRPPDADSERTRRTLVRIAGEQLSLYGYARTTFRAIAQEAGLTEGAVYYYFPSKVAMVKAVLDEVDEVVLPNFNRVLSENRSFATRVEALVADPTRNVPDPSVQTLVRAGNMLVMDGRRYEELVPVLKHWVGLYEKFFLRVTMDAIQDGELPPDTDVTAVVDLLRGLAYGIAGISDSFPKSCFRRLGHVVHAMIRGDLQRSVVRSAV